MAPRSLAAVPPIWIGAGTLMAGLVLLALWAQALNPLTSDVAWLITVAERMLDGQQLYVDIAETNPPMSAWLYLPSVSLAAWLGVDPGVVVAASTIAFAFLCMALCDHIMAPLVAPAWRPIAWVVATAVLCVVPGTGFAQREHIAVLALLPSLCTLYAASVGRGEARWQGLAYGALAGLALAVKPQLGLGLLLPVVALAWRDRSLAPFLALRHFVIGGILCAYAAAVVILHPAFGTIMLPLVNDTYLASRSSALQHFVNAHFVLGFMCLAWLLWLHRRRLGQPDVFIPLLASLGFACAYFLAGKAFSYHLLPANSVLVLSLVLTVLGALPEMRRPMLVTAAFVLMLLAAPGPGWLNMDRWQDGLVDAADDYGPIRSIALISDDLGQASPLHRSLDAELINAGPSLWAARGALIQASLTADPDRRQYLLGLANADRVALRDRIAAEHPDILIVSDGDIDWRAWANQDEQFRALFADYRAVARVPFKKDTVSVLVRNDLQPR